MISAKEAFSKTQEACESIFKTMIDDVEEEIEDAICNGLFSCPHEGELPDGIIKMLEDKGFSVTQHGLPSDVRYEIRWSVIK